MKKLLVTLAAGILAVGVNAASINWSAAKGYLYDGAGDSAAKVTSGTAYLVLATYSQGDLVSAFATANGDAATTLATITTLGTGTIADNARISGTGTTSATDTITAYFVVFNDDKMYVSATGDSVYDGLAQAHDLAFTTSMTSSSKLTLQAADGYSGAGWYAVPEPTSGLLLLLGVAGLALKRKRA